MTLSCWFRLPWFCGRELKGASLLLPFLRYMPAYQPQYTVVPPGATATDCKAKYSRYILWCWTPDKSKTRIRGQWAASERTAASPRYTGGTLWAFRPSHFRSTGNSYVRYCSRGEAPRGDYWYGRWLTLTVTRKYLCHRCPVGAASTCWSLAMGWNA